jgi:hypothetical protein
VAEDDVHQGLVCYKADMSSHEFRYDKGGGLEPIKYFNDRSLQRRASITNNEEESSLLLYVCW